FGRRLLVLFFFLLGRIGHDRFGRIGLAEHTRHDQGSHGQHDDANAGDRQNQATIVATIALRLGLLESWLVVVLIFVITWALGRFFLERRCLAVGLRLGRDRLLDLHVIQFLIGGTLLSLGGLGRHGDVLALGRGAADGCLILGH